MSIMELARKPVDRPVIVTICGDAGRGKTSLAAAFPKPIFIRAEDGMQAIPTNQRPDAFPLLQNATQLWEQITAVIHEPHDYQTLVIDSVTALERMFITDVLAQDPKAKSINQALGGYGAGPAAVAAMHQRVRKGAGLANEKRNMNVVFIAHVDVETLRMPDIDDHMRWTLRMPTKSQPPYIDDVDLVGLIRLVAYTKGEDGDRKKIISTGDRELVCHAIASSVTKNRFGISEPLEYRMGENPLASAIPIFGAKAAPPAKQPAKKAAQQEEGVN